MLGLTGGVMQTTFLEQQGGAGLGEGEALGAEGGRRDEVAEAVVEAADQIGQHVAVIDTGADVTKRVGEALDPGAEGGDGHVALDDVVELLLGVDGALEAVVEEEPGDGGPEGRGGVRWLDDGVGDVGRDSGVEQVDDALVDLRPDGSISMIFASREPST